MKLRYIKLLSTFRGLSAGFELYFRSPTATEKELAEPICLVGLNGSGKSNTLEAISEIYYYLELFSISDTKSLKKTEDRYRALGFIIEYEISPIQWNTARSKMPNDIPIPENAKVTISCNKTPKDFLKITAKTADQEITLSQEILAYVLPTNVIGYSSGQNELISNPFIKLDFHYFDEFQKRKNTKEFYGDLDVNRMFFMDYESNELVLLANYLFVGNDIFSYKQFKELNQRLNIGHLYSFSLKIQFKDYKNEYIDLPSELNIGIEKLKKCATTSIDNEADLAAKNKKNRVIKMSFFTDASVRKAFRNIFKTPFELFRLFYLLRLLNIHCFTATTRNQIKDAKQGTNLLDLIPKPTLDKLVFKIDNIKLSKTTIAEPLRYKHLSDGEHQLLHIMGTLHLMQSPDVLFLLDEPETHFNPEWRAKMISLIMQNNIANHQHQDYFITSHSPFIISDCKPDNVFIFNKKDGKINIETAANRRLNTFGTSVNILTEEVFNKNESIGDYAIEKLNAIKNRDFNSLEDIQQAKEDARILGESVEKVLLFHKLLRLEDELQNQKDAPK